MKEHKIKGWYNSGRHPTRINNKKLKACQLWENLKQRSCEMGKDYLTSRQKSYAGSTCCDEWKDYSVFYEWFEEQKASGRFQEGWELDKEVLKSGNKHYCPEYCCFIPKALNCILTAPKGNTTGFRGVGRHSDRDCYFVTVHVGDNRIKTKSGFKTPEEAFEFYVEQKKQYILSVLDNYRDVLQEDVIKGIEQWEILPCVP